MALYMSHCNHMQLLWQQLRCQEVQLSGQLLDGLPDLSELEMGSLLNPHLLAL